MEEKKEVTPELKSCRNCHGMGVLERPNGDTVECPVCKGEGFEKRKVR